MAIEETARPVIAETSSRALDWFVVRTNPNCEDRAVASIREAGFEAYKPERRKEYQHNRSKRWIERTFPLFVGYVFLGLPAGRPHQFGRIRLCDGVKMILGSNPRDPRSRPIAVPSRLIAELLEMQAAGQFDDMRAPIAAPHDFVEGEVVTLVTGALAKLQLTVADPAGREQIIVLGEMFASVRELGVAAKKLRRAV
ncbi:MULTISPECIES: transcription termination/antitermination protein NusG [unclassified Aureimonas]|uniref:transcription termination/antitermination protein NusG n=1 Tax=unclassified Aureimonas TaxID=2615206 RepID=UPI00070154A1|nr:MULTISPECIES: transcription termination/antitermination NusG family protein [unclassified Aureimonas]KQT52258.1 hypothetical protein ASG62_16515 [Aureimonas sp. Leaf427]KQT65738.1 hypothetical protein ASG54_22545 [Aureimonas sp. Leaf460]